MIPPIDPKNTILFVGAGVSTNLGLPSWSKLIDEIGTQLGFDPRVFKVYGNHLSLAEYYCLQRGGIGKLRSWMDVEWHDKDKKIENSPIHELIAKACFRKIYTTNFDRWIEKACEHYDVPFHKIVNVNDIASNKKDLMEIVKFHGDFDDDETLVLTESNYFDRLDFDTPLDIMLRADVLKYPMLFIGYSLSDINIRYLFHKVSKIWRQAGLDTARPESFIYMGRPNPIDEKVFANWGITPIVENVDPKIGLQDLLRSLTKS